MSLEKIREEIDGVDAKLIALLEKRFALVLELLPHKKQLSDQQREEKILSKIDSAYIKEVYEEIFRLSKELLKRNQR